MKDSKLGGHKKPKEAKLGGGKKSVKAKSVDTERSLADRLDGIVTPASGALAHARGDVRLKHFLLDSKETEFGSIVVDNHMLTKITREADGEGLKPGLVLKIEKLPFSVEKEWAVIPLSVFAQMLEAGQDKDLE